jgi:propanediol dehydratase small subunit
MSADSAKDVRYPLGEHHRDAIRSATGRPLADLSLEAIRDGSMTAADLTIHRETLELQATIAEEAGFPQVAKGLRRAAELTNIPNDRLLELYQALRPGRSTYYQLLSLSQEVASRFDATETAHYIREAADAYRDTGLLRMD